MKKLILLFLIAASTVTITQAQLLPSFKAGVKGGLNFTRLSSNDKLFNSSNSAGFFAGAWGRVGIAGIHIQPELYYTNKVSKINQSNTSGEVKFSTIDLPILIGTRVGLGPIGARIQAGPLFSFVVDKTLKPVTGLDNNFKNNMTALAFGIGADIKKITFDLRYEHGLSKANNQLADKQKLNLWTIGIGYSFL